MTDEAGKGLFRKKTIYPSAIISPGPSQAAPPSDAEQLHAAIERLQNATRDLPRTGPGQLPSRRTAATITPAATVDLVARLLDDLRSPILHRNISSFLAPDGSTPEAAGMHAAEQEAARIRGAKIIHVADEMVELIKWASHVFPGEAIIRREALPDLFGVVVFESPWMIETPPLRDSINGKVDANPEIHNVRAMTWGPSPTFPSHLATGPGDITINVYADTDCGDDILMSVTRSRYESSGLPFNVQMVMTNTVALHVGRTIDEHTPPALRRDREQGFQDLDTVLAARADENFPQLLYVLCSLMTQTITATSEQPLPRTAARRAKRMNLPQTVAVVQLRRIAQDYEQAGSTAVEWKHRWLVDGHWRRQRYGPGNQHIKEIYISPHIKGPDGAPLKISQKVYTLRR